MTSVCLVAEGEGRPSSNIMPTTFASESQMKIKTKQEEQTRPIIHPMHLIKSQVKPIITISTIIILLCLKV